MIAVDSSDGTLGTSNAIKVGANIQFAGDSTYYRVSAVSETVTDNQTALVRLTASVSSANAIADNTAVTVTTSFSNIRLTGHDFLDIGTGDFTTTNYPGGPSQPADQSDEVSELLGGRVYFSSTDQQGDFRVGDLFRIEQATGVATLNADAFDLSGLSELQLGSIGAELGATINEFSTDETLSNDSNTAVPTERAIVGYTQRDKMGTGHLVPPTGTTAQRPTGGNLKTGGLRYNSTLVTWEGYNGTQWTGLGGGNPWATHTADGSTALTVAANDRYFIDTTAGAQTANLPASPQTGDQVSFIDLAGTFDTNNLTIGRNSLKIMGLTEDLVISTENAGIQLVYTGSTYGWKLVTVL
nr:phage tail fiber-like protein [uncultured Mediterranean phage uvMED]